MGGPQPAHRPTLRAVGPHQRLQGRTQHGPPRGADLAGGPGGQRPPPSLWLHRTPRPVRIEFQRDWQGRPTPHRPAPGVAWTRMDGGDPAGRHPGPPRIASSRHGHGTGPPAGRCASRTAGQIPSEIRGIPLPAAAARPAPEPTDHGLARSGLRRGRRAVQSLLFRADSL